MKKIVIIISAVVIISYLSYLTYDKKVTFDKYSTVQIINPNYNFGNKFLGDKLNYKFRIKNISNQPFTITNIYCDEDIKFINTRIKKIIDTEQEAVIEIEVVLTEKGTYKKLIQVESNSDKGLINLKINGNVK